MPEESLENVTKLWCRIASEHRATILSAFSQLDAVGQVSFVFSDANNGTMTYTVDGITQSKAITREVYASPATVCR